MKSISYPLTVYTEITDYSSVAGALPLSLVEGSPPKSIEIKEYLIHHFIQ